MADVYTELAKKLDELPQGFPSTESGLELKILRKIFTPEEAEMALKIKPVPETVETIAERLGKPLPEMQAILDDMVEKGQIGSFKLFGEQMYMFFPFVVGIYEFQGDRLDKELAEMFEEYLPTLVRKVGGFTPAMARVVPVETVVEGDMLVHRYEDVRRMIDEAKSFEVHDCICRVEQALEGNPCKHTVDICLGISNEEDGYSRYEVGKVISKEEAFKVLEKAEEEGLVHCTYNVQMGQTFVCNCCPCCCGILRGAKDFNAPYLLAKSNFVALVDPDGCTQCGVCADERCPMDAIAEEGGEYRVLPERCIGCGVCIPTCPTEAIQLVRRPEIDQDTPPADLIDWSVQRAATRGVKLELD